VKPKESRGLLGLGDSHRIYLAIRSLLRFPR
jgi:hypothetical protein